MAIKEVNDQPLTAVGDSEQVMQTAGNKPILLRILRHGSGGFVAIAAH
jgi:hypothetical protein